MFDEGLTALALDLRGVGEQGLEVAVLLQEQRGRLLTDAGHAGNVVRRVAGKPENVDHPFGWDAEALDDRVPADRLVLAVVQTNQLANELHHVLVGRDDDTGPPCLGPARRERADDVVCLEAGDLEGGNPEGGRRLPTKTELWFQIVRGLPPIGLVGVIQRGSERTALRVENDRDMRRVVLFEERHEKAHETENGVGRRAVGRRHGRPKSVVGAENEARAIDQVQRVLVCHLRSHRFRCRTVSAPDAP
jgi:hypothetical protein